MDKHVLRIALEILETYAILVSSRGYTCMPSPNYKGKNSQLNVWVLPETAEFLRSFAKDRHMPIGKGLDAIIKLLRDHP